MTDYQTHTAAPRSGAFMSDAHMLAWLTIWRGATPAIKVDMWDKTHRGDYLLVAAEGGGCSAHTLESVAVRIAEIALSESYAELLRVQRAGDLVSPPYMLTEQARQHWNAHELHATADAIHALAHARHVHAHSGGMHAALAADHYHACRLLADPDGREVGAQRAMRQTADIVRAMIMFDGQVFSGH